MRKILLILFCALTYGVYAQVTTTPAIIQKGYKGEIVITYDPTAGNGGMKTATKCFAHTGLITAASTADSDWKYVLDEWRGTSTAAQCTLVDGKWQFTIPNIYTFYNCPETEEIFRIAFVFHDGPGGSLEGKTSDGKDIFVDLADAGLAVSIESNIEEISNLSDNITLECNATADAELTLKCNGEVVKQGSGKQIVYTTTLTQAGNYVYSLEAKQGEQIATDTVITCVPTQPVEASRPAGISMGIYYNETDPTKVTLATFAAGSKQPHSKTDLVSASNVFVVGDFNNWVISNDYQMKKDGHYFWFELSNLVPQKEYAMQYVVKRADGKVIRISDLYSEKVLHPDDKWEPKQVDPTLMDYPAKGSGYVTVIQTDKPKFQWSDATNNFVRPNKNNLLVYELWVYDHTPEHSLQGLIGRLDYIKNLGVNAIELMPMCEFDNNFSWGYNPNHYFALDKAYGTPEQFKTFVDECHKRGMAVIIDMVFNHTNGNNPMCKLYPYGDDLQYNPWFNVKSKVPHGDAGFGEDWNHAFAPAHEMFIRVLQYWIQEYKVDGYRLDLSHGICGTTYDAVYQLKDYYQKGVKDVAADAYMILEHWGSGTNDLVVAGMMPWNRCDEAFGEAAMGWLTGKDSFFGANKDNYISYNNSHDEERTFFKATLWGNGAMKTSEVERCKRVPLTLGFMAMLDGSHMLYHFDELGFDYSKWQNAEGEWGKNDDGVKPYGEITLDSESNFKMEGKFRPEPAGWFTAASPRMGAYKKTAQAFQLRTRYLPNVFEGNPTNLNIGSGVALRTIQWGSNVFVAGNFSTTETKTLTLPGGVWYDYYAGGKAATTYQMQPGEFKIFTALSLPLPKVPNAYDFNTGIEEIIWPTEDGNNLVVKRIEDNQIVIIKDGIRYNILGAIID